MKRHPTAEYKRLGPKLRELVTMMGRRADDPELVEWVTTKLGKKAPEKSSHDGVNVVAKKAGLELAFSHRVLNDKYPPVEKKARSFIPYLSHAWIGDKFGEKVFDLDPSGATEAEITKAVGAPDGRRPRFMSDTKPEIAYWRRVVDSGADVIVELEFAKGLRVEVTLASAGALEEFMDPSTHVFVAWAAEHGLLDAARFADHAELLTNVTKRRALGSDLVKAALPRGLWDDHLRADEKLRRTAYQWFHNMNDLWITKDLKKVFGKREGPHGHDEPKLDDDGWDKVDAAATAFNKVFGTWCR